MNIVERAQVKFFKKVMCWPRNTPDYMVRLETGRFHLSSQILKRILNYWKRILTMSDDRLPKLCLDLHKQDGNKVEWNWFSQLQNWLSMLGEPDTAFIEIVKQIVKFQI